MLGYRLHHGHLPCLGSVAVVVLARWPVWLVLIANLLWVFPDGRLPQGRWRRVAVVLIAGGALLAVAATGGCTQAVAPARCSLRCRRGPGQQRDRRGGAGRRAG